MTMKASQVIDLARQQLSDSGLTMRWSDAALLTYLNLAQKQVVLMRPDSSAAIQVVQLDPGNVQSLPEGTYRYLGAVQNMGSDGLTQGLVIANGDMEAMDEFDPEWRSGNATDTQIKECFFDAAVPKGFWCYPAVPAAGSVYVSIRISKVPTELTSLNDDLVIAELYELPLALYTLGLAYGENSDVGDKRLSASYLNQASQILGVKTKVESVLPPSEKEDEA